MPVYEFRCSGCGHVFETLTPTMAMPEGLACPQCDGKELRRMLSSFFSHSAQQKAPASMPDACRQCGGGASPSCPYSNQ